MIRVNQGFPGQSVVALPIEVINQMREQMAVGSFLTCMAGFFPQALGHYCAREKGISDTHMLIYCIEGEGKAIINGVEYTIKEDMFFHIDKRTPHSFMADRKKPWTQYWIHFDLLPNDPLYTHLATPCVKRVNKLSRVETIALFEKLIVLLGKEATPELLILANNTAAHLVALLYFNECYEAQSDDHEEKLLIDLCEHYMIESLHKKLSLEDIGLQYGYSISYLQRLFKRERGVSPKRYFIQLKIDKAKEYLATSTLSIRQIAIRVGYTDPLHFSRLFKKITSLNPTQYRNTCKKSIT